ncbi:MAG: HAMP domain-containing protein, partial [Oscillospiraceae bacterium]|nr:HAMP domain-containing protein [Oscillospiraceae bacterium]
MLLLPVVFLSSYINQRFMRDSIKQVTQAKVQLLESYMSQIDWELGLAGNYVSTITFRNSTTVYLADRSSPDFYYAANRLNQDTIREGVYYQYVSGFFLFVPDTEFYYIYSIDGESSGRQNTLETFFREKLLPQKDSSDWHYTEVNGSAYLIKYSSSNGIYGGAFLALDHLHIEGTDIRFQTAGQLAQTETPRNSVLLSAASALCDLQICETMERQKVVESLPLLQQYLQIITVFMLLSVPLLFVMLRRLIVRPLHRLTDAMRRLESGDLDFRLSANTGAQEFQQIEGTFNHMSREIKGLKIA